MPTIDAVYLDDAGTYWTCVWVSEAFVTLTARPRRRRYVALREWPAPWLAVA